MWIHVSEKGATVPDPKSRWVGPNPRFLTVVS